MFAYGCGGGETDASTFFGSPDNPALLSVRMTDEKTDPDVAVLCPHEILTYSMYTNWMTFSDDVTPT
jgi:hypothetical protein